MSPAAKRARFIANQQLGLHPCVTLELWRLDHLNQTLKVKRAKLKLVQRLQQTTKCQRYTDTAVERTLLLHQLQETSKETQIKLPRRFSTTDTSSELRMQICLLIRQCRLNGHMDL